MNIENIIWKNRYESLVMKLQDLQESVAFREGLNKSEERVFEKSDLIYVSFDGETVDDVKTAETLFGNHYDTYAIVETAEEREERLGPKTNK